MKYQLRVTPRAQHDIAEALMWTLEHFGASQLNEYVELIRLAKNDIVTDPDGPLAKRRPDLHPDARIFHIARPGRRARHMFVYRPTADGFVEVARFLHDSVDLPRHLPPEHHPDM